MVPFLLPNWVIGCTDVKAFPVVMEMFPLLESVTIGNQHLLNTELPL